MLDVLWVLVGEVQLVISSVVMADVYCYRFDGRLEIWMAYPTI
jgi:hypothetical protein